MPLESQIPVVDMPGYPSGYFKTDSGNTVFNVISPGWILNSTGRYYKNFSVERTQPTTTVTYATVQPIAPVVVKLTIASPLTNVPAVPTVSCAVPDSYPILTTLSAPSKTELLRDYFYTSEAVPLKAFEIRFGDNFGDSSTQTRYPIPTTTLLLKIGSGLNAINVYSNRVTYYVGSTLTIKGMVPIAKGAVLGVAYSVSAAGIATVSVYRNGTLVYTRGGIPTVVSGTLDVWRDSVSYLEFAIGTPATSGYCYAINTGSNFFLDTAKRIISRTTNLNYNYGVGCVNFDSAQSIPT